ncbi:Hypothetical predicted protein [Octopus vulgaris]|uniref:Uncharacterized protein n=1 Tax=Octopus vulgaris TaxID=6645 RepID=A0AA36BEG5_OCTVU|nr:Hypothetical predicted protein [Octopus vulgaris]
MDKTKEHKSEMDKSKEYKSQMDKSKEHKSQIQWVKMTKWNIRSLSLLARSNVTGNVIQCEASRQITWVEVLQWIRSNNSQYDGPVDCYSTDERESRAVRSTRKSFTLQSRVCAEVPKRV